MSRIRSASAVVVGGGIAGASALYHLADAGVESVLVEKTGLAAATTGRSSAVVGAFYGSSAECRLALASLAELEAFRDLTGADPRFTRSGLLETAGPQDAGALIRSVDQRRSIGCEIHLLDAAELGSRFPNVAVDGVTVAAYDPRAGYADPKGTTTAYAVAAERLGASLLLGCEAEQLIVRHNRIEGLGTSDGIIATDTVVLANSLGSLDLLGPVGVDIDLTPRPVQYARFRGGTPQDDFPALLDDTQGFWVRHDADGYLTGLEFVPPGHLSSTDERRYAALCADKLRRRVDVAATFECTDFGSVLVAMTRDGRPVVDRVPDLDGLFVVVGDSGISFKFAPVSGSAIADWVVGRPATHPDIEIFAVGRFDAGALKRPELRPGGHRRTVHLLRELARSTAGAAPSGAIEGGAPGG